MKITVESYGKKYVTEYDYDDCSIDDYVESFFNLLIANGFHHDTVQRGFEEFIETKNL
jgi:hypothetical protein